MRVLFILIFLIAVGCTEDKKIPASEEKYAETTIPLVEASQKLANEPDVHKLHTVALAMDQTRTLACDDYNGECNQFASFLTYAIKVSAKGSLTKEESAELKQKAEEIVESFKSGRKKLHDELAARAKH